MGKMATMRPRCSVHKKSRIAIGREIVPVRSAFLDGSFLFSVWRGYRGAPQTMDFIGGQGDQPFVFSSDMEVLEDFSPLSTNATYWRTCQDTFEGAMPQCLRGDACGGFATGKYSQTIVGKRRWFPQLKEEPIFQGKVYFEFHFWWKSIIGKGSLHKLLGRRGWFPQLWTQEEG